MMKIRKIITLAIFLVSAFKTMQAAYKVGLGSDRFIGSSSFDFKDLPLRSAGKPPFFCDDASFKRISDIGGRPIAASDNLMATCWNGVSIRDNNRFLYYYSEFREVVELPFPYKPLSKQDFCKTYYGYQNCAFVIKDDECAVVGPLCPCIGIFVTRTDCSETLVMHVDSRVQFETVKNQIDVFVDGFDPASFTVSVYTRMHKELSGDTMVLAVGNYLKNRGIKNVTTTIWQKYDAMRSAMDSGFFPPYYTATCGVFVTSSGKLFSVCLTTEVIKLFQSTKEDGYFLNESFSIGIYTVGNINDFCSNNYYDSQTYTLSQYKMFFKNFALKCHKKSYGTE